MDGKLYIGIDICRDYSQIVCISEKFSEPQSLGKDGPAESYLIPTGSLDSENLTRLLRNMLNLTRLTSPDDTIAYVGVSLEKLPEEKEEKVKSALKESFENIGIKEDRLVIVPHNEALLAYVVHGKRTLWSGDTVLFEFRDENLYSVRLTINKKIKPMMAEIRETDYGSYLKAPDILKDPVKAAESFDEAAENAVSVSNMVSCIYASGRGFESTFADEVLVKYATGRKVYKGQNLYAKGACFIAKMKAENEEQLVTLLDSDMIPASLRLKVYADGKEQEIELVPPLTKYSEATVVKDLILDDTDRLEFRFIDVRSDVKSKFDLLLDGLPARNPRMTRVRLSIDFTEAYSCRIKAVDMGFGTFIRPDESDEGIRHEWQTVMNI